MHSLCWKAWPPGNDRRRVYLRVAEADGTVYIDCGNADCQTIRIANAAGKSSTPLPSSSGAPKSPAAWPPPFAGDA